MALRSIVPCYGVVATTDLFRLQQCNEGKMEGIIQSFDGTHYKVYYPVLCKKDRLMEYEFELDGIETLLSDNNPSTKAVESSAATTTRNDKENELPVLPDSVESQMGSSKRNETNSTAGVKRARTAATVDYQSWRKEKKLARRKLNNLSLA